MNIQSFTFGYFQENTYVLWDETKECVIIDPGNTNLREDNTLFDFIESHHLKPVRLLLTHGHLDHIAGNDAVFNKYKLLPEVHAEDLFLIQTHEITANMYGIPCNPSPLPKNFIKDKDVVKFGNSELLCIHTPGHSPGSISYYNSKDNFLIAGDVLFYESIGRTDLPKGDFDTLKNSIQKKLYTLPDVTIVYPGHGPATSIGYEKENNMFVRVS
ncbi:MAG: MBL fold metallo-hydrolase [Bacteroidetes bacterium]|nr:MAG: MBL fold metallo-hydrolase [Bacteroidota bacterium]